MGAPLGVSFICSAAAALLLILSEVALTGGQPFHPGSAGHKSVAKASTSGQSVDEPSGGAPVSTDAGGTYGTDQINPNDPGTPDDQSSSQQPSSGTAASTDPMGMAQQVISAAPPVPLRP